MTFIIITNHQAHRDSDLPNSICKLSHADKTFSSDNHNAMDLMSSTIISLLSKNESKKKNPWRYRL
jgi:hypothetical protein